MNVFTSRARLFKGFVAAFTVGVAIASTHAEASVSYPSVRVINHTNQPIVAVFVSHDYDPDGVSNRLNMPELEAEMSVVIDPYDGGPGCIYDFTVLLKDRTYFTQRVNTCPIQNLAFWH